MFKWRQCIFTNSVLSPLGKYMSFIWINFNSLHLRCFVPSLVEIGQVVLEKKILQSDQSIFGSSLFSPREILLCLRMLHVKFGWKWSMQRFWRRQFLKSLQCIFEILLNYISGWKRAWSIIWTNLNPFHPCQGLSVSSIDMIEIGPYGRTGEATDYMQVITETFSSGELKTKWDWSCRRVSRCW